MLIEFWDVCRPSSHRTLPYLRAWHERYAAAGAGLRVIGVHSSALDAGHDEARVREADRAAWRSRIRSPSIPGFLLWRAYATPGWPSRYLFAPPLKLFDTHHGEGDYAGTERAIQELLEIDEPLTPLHGPCG